MLTVVEQRMIDSNENMGSIADIYIDVSRSIDATLIGSIISHEKNTRWFDIVGLHREIIEESDPSSDTEGHTLNEKVCCFFSPQFDDLPVRRKKIGDSRIVWFIF
jgi:hypothetical protein